MIVLSITTVENVGTCIIKYFGADLNETRLDFTLFGHLFFTKWYIWLGP